MNQKLTPLMRQYWDVKAAHADKILLFRMGDFFELFHDDAVKAAPVLGIALTRRNQKAADETPMCGVPHHSIGNYINKLLKAGFKIAICDQVEDPKFAKGLVKRAVTRILSPGMVFDPDTLDQLQPNYLAAFDDSVVAFADSSTGEAFYYAIQNPAELDRLIALLRPIELVLKEGQEYPGAIHISRFSTSEEPGLPDAAGRLKAYVRFMQSGAPVIPLEFEKRRLVERLELTQNTIRHLEIFETTRGQTSGSLFAVINKTCTAGGARWLRSWLAFPLANIEHILKRQREISSWVERPAHLKDVRETLSQIGDLERRASKMTFSNANARDLVSLSASILAALELPGEFGGGETKKLALEIRNIIIADPPLSIRDGNLVQKGANPELDRLIKLTEDSQSLLMEMEAREKQRTGIPSLKIRYNNIFGYSIEITNAHKDKAPPEYRRKQTLAGAERYVTEELENLERSILSAQGRRCEVELQIFEDLKSRACRLLPEILSLAHACNHLDAIASLAWLALENNYCQPEFSPQGIAIEGSRHPVIEKMTELPFVANSLKMAAGDCMILTGPNMAGKSTLMRQAAITSVLAQIGSFVPAVKAQLPVFRKVLTRIGSNDSLSEGLSTFMVEMTETAELLREADSGALVVLDEVGRGTSTFDGMSLAQAILEYLLTHNRATVFFATHYHELTHLETVFPHCYNFHMGIKERGGEISFLYTLKTGPANKSYGIHVARLAGLPKEVVQRAEKILSSMESEKTQMSLFERRPKMPKIISQQAVDFDEKSALVVPELENFWKNLENPD